jgi:hypothetical protein
LYPKETAVLDGHKYVPLGADRFGQNKFAGTMNGNYIAVADAFCKIIAQGSTIVKWRGKSGIRCFSFYEQWRGKQWPATAIRAESRRGSRLLI